MLRQEEARFLINLIANEYWNNIANHDKPVTTMQEELIDLINISDTSEALSAKLRDAISALTLQANIGNTLIFTTTEEVPAQPYAFLLILRLSKTNAELESFKIDFLKMGHSCINAAIEILRGQIKLPHKSVAPHPKEAQLNHLFEDFKRSIDDMQDVHTPENLQLRAHFALTTLINAICAQLKITSKLLQITEQRLPKPSVILANIFFNHGVLRSDLCIPLNESITQLHSSIYQPHPRIKDLFTVATTSTQMLSTTQCIPFTLPKKHLGAKFNRISKQIATEQLITECKDNLIPMLFNTHPLPKYNTNHNHEIINYIIITNHELWNERLDTNTQPSFTQAYALRHTLDYLAATTQMYKGFYLKFAPIYFNLNTNKRRGLYHRPEEELNLRAYNQVTELCLTTINDYMINSNNPYPFNNVISLLRNLDRTKQSKGLVRLAKFYENCLRTELQNLAKVKHTFTLDLSNQDQYRAFMQHQDYQPIHHKLAYIYRQLFNIYPRLTKERHAYLNQLRDQFLDIITKLDLNTVDKQTQAIANLIKQWLIFDSMFSHRYTDTKLNLLAQIPYFGGIFNFFFKPKLNNYNFALAQSIPNLMQAIQASSSLLPIVHTLDENASFSTLQSNALAVYHSVTPHIINHHLSSDHTLFNQLLAQEYILGAARFCDGNGKASNHINFSTTHTLNTTTNYAAMQAQVQLNQHKYTPPHSPSLWRNNILNAFNLSIAIIIIIFIPILLIITQLHALVLTMNNKLNPWSTHQRLSKQANRMAEQIMQHPENGLTRTSSSSDSLVPYPKAILSSPPINRTTTKEVPSTKRSQVTLT